jgi:hypothetical protein
MKRLFVSLILVGAAMMPAAALADGPQVTDPPQQQVNPSSFARNCQAFLGPLRSEIARGNLENVVNPFNGADTGFSGQFNPGGHYGTVGEAQFLSQNVGLSVPAPCTQDK